MPKFIAIDGHGGSGKTHISNLLAERLAAQVLHLDDYGDDFRPFIGIPTLINYLKHAEADVVIYEGIGVYDSRFDEFSAYRIFVDTSHTVRTSRVASRDVPRANRTTEDWQRIFAIWDEAERTYFTPELVESADLIIDNDGIVDLDLVIRKIESFWLRQQIAITI